MSESESPSRTEVGIPYFFYDVIGRILPGGFLVFGVILSWKGLKFFNDIWNEVKQFHSIETGAATLVLGVGVLLFVNVSSLAGSMLASLAHESVGKFWERRRPLNLAGLNTFLGAAVLPLLQEQFKSQFHSDLTDNQGNLKGASNLCTYHLLKVAPKLGVISARHDAESLGAQSMVFSIVILIAISVLKLCLNPSDTFLKYWLAILAVGLIGYGYTFSYHRRKKLYGRFALYMVTNEHANKNKRVFE